MSNSAGLSSVRAAEWGGKEDSPRDERLAREARKLRLDTFIRLRWLAVAGQTIAIAVAAGFGLRFPIAACPDLVAASALLNLAPR